MKIFIFVISILSCQFAIAQSTGFTEDFNGSLKTVAPSSFELIQNNGVLTVHVVKEASKLWQGIEYSFDENIDIRSFPYLNIRLKSSVSTLLTVHIVDALSVQMTSNIKVYASDEFVEYLVDFTPASSVGKNFISKLRLTTNGNSVESFNCELQIDEFKIGTDAVLLAGIGSNGNQKVFINSTNNKIKILDIKNVENLEATSSGGNLVNLFFTEIYNNKSILSYDCKNGYVGEDTIIVKAIGLQGYTDNEVRIPIAIEDNSPPYFNEIKDNEVSLGDTLIIRISSIEDGNSTVEQSLLLSASSNNQNAVPDSNIFINYQKNYSLADLIIVPIKDTVGTEITVSLDDQYSYNNIFSDSFILDVFTQINNPPKIDLIPDQAAYIENGEFSIQLLGLTDGDNNSQDLKFEISSTNEEVVPNENLSVNYNQGADKGILRIIPQNIGTTQIELSVEDNGGNNVNNGNASTSVKFELEVISLPQNGHAADFSSFDNWGRDYANGQQSYELGTFKGRENVLKITLNSKSCWTGTTYTTPELDLSNHRYLSYDIYFEGESFEGVGLGGRTHCYLYDDGWDADVDRNLPEAHNQRKFVAPDNWKTVFMDFRGDGGIENNEGEDINIKRVQKVLLNYASNFTWPFPIDNGVVYIANLKIGNAVNDSLIPTLDIYCTIDPISNQTAFSHAEEKNILITGISNGQLNGVLPTISGTSSDTNIVSNPVFETIDSNGNTNLRLKIKGNIGRSEISIDVNAEGSLSKSRIFHIDIVDDNISKTVDVELFPDTLYQTIRGFGTFQFSGNPAYLDKYTEELGASAVRIGIISNQIEPINDNDDPNVLHLEGYNFDAFDFDYFKELKRKGVETFILTSWSPPAWMKRNLSVDYGYASAPDYELTDNILEPYYYDEFAESMVAVVKMFKLRADIDLYAIGIQNEPAFNEPYASAVLSPAKFAELISIVGKRFENEGINTKLYMPEQVFSQGHYSMVEYLTALFNHSDAQKYTDIIATHSYGEDGIKPGQPSFPGWSTLWSKSQEGNEPKELWMSETYPESESWDDAMSLAGAIYGAFKYGNVSLWTLWNIEGTLIETGAKLPLFYTSQNYYKFIKPGAMRIKCTSEHEDILVTSFVDQRNSRLTSVLINKNPNPITVRIIGRTDSIPSVYEVYTSAKNIPFEKTEAIGENQTLALLGQSVTTIVGNMKGELVVKAQNQNVIPTGFKLYQNYPNPFNPITKIKYTIPKAVKVKLEIFNILGQNIKTVVNQFQNPGNYEISLNAANFASGVYFYRINTASFKSVKKMILLK